VALLLDWAAAAGARVGSLRDAVAPEPQAGRDAGEWMPLKVTLTIGDHDLRFFRNAIKEAREEAKGSTDEQIIEAARAMVESMSGTDMPEFVQERVDRLDALILMLSDDKWGLPKSIHTNVMSALAYFVNPKDLIPDSVPALGFLDDAIMIELIVRELKHDIEAYQDFLDFGRRHKERPGQSEEVVDSQEFKQVREKLRSRGRRRARADRARRSSRSRLF